MSKKQMYGWLAIIFIIAVVIEFIIAGFLLLRSQAGCSSLCGDSFNSMILIAWMFGVTFAILVTAMLFIGLNKKD